MCTAEVDVGADLRGGETGETDGVKVGEEDLSLVIVLVVQM